MKTREIIIDGVTFVGRLIASREKIFVGYKPVMRHGVEQQEEVWKPVYIKACYRQAGVPKAVQFVSEWKRYPLCEADAWGEAESKLRTATVRTQLGLTAVQS